MATGGAESESSTGTSQSSAQSTKATALIVLGMAGSGKTTFVQMLTAYLHTKKSPPYVLNLDPAVHNVPYPTNVDIRDTVKYKEVMKQHGLGPNGAIMTSLNLFATKFDQVMSLVEKRCTEYEYIILDTPGQIEVFTWSASGAIITETLNDIVDHGFAVEWMRDFEVFQDALNFEQAHIGNLTRSMSLVLDEFYKDLRLVGFSSITGEGMTDLLSTIAQARDEYDKEYKPEYEKRKSDMVKRAEKQRNKTQMSRFKKDFDRDNLIRIEPMRASDLLGREGGSSDDEDDSLSDELDPEDEAEMKEKESLSRFLERHKVNAEKKQDD